MSMANPRDTNSISYKLRSKRDVALRTLIEKIGQRKDRVRIIDMGGTFEYWRRVGIGFLVKQRATVTVVNLSAGDISITENLERVFESKLGNACSMPEFGDAQFDLAHSNSVIEHVGSWSNMKAFAFETRRIAESYYVQTPYFWFPVDPHFFPFPMFHWLPRPLRARLLNTLPIAHSGRVPGVDLAYEAIEGARLLDGRQFRFLFPDSTIGFEKVCGIKKSMIATRFAD